MHRWNAYQNHQSNTSHPAPQFYSPVSSHYAQAYLQALPHAQSLHAQPAFPQPSAATYSAWSQPGSHKCTYKQCTFSGTQKSIEIHMMDRHLIYPPNYSKNKKKDDWDADPSLKGKPIPIQGTSIILKTKEDVDAWIAERRSRFPTASRVTEKREKLKEAIARGQLHLDDNPRFPKRPRLDSSVHGNNRGRGGARGRGRGVPFKGRNPSSPRSSSSAPIHLPSSLPPRPSFNAHVSSSSSGSSDSEDDGPPESMPSKITKHPPTKEVPEQETSCTAEPPQQQSLLPSSSSIPPIKKPAVRQPRNPPTYPFASKPSLLRNLLLPEIRNTVSNLSQAIRFLVDNDFLDNVELKPGDASGHQKIQVITSEEHKESKSNIQL